MRPVHIRTISRILPALLIGWTLGGTVQATETVPQQGFDSPEAATDALLEGLRTDDLDALGGIFGPQHMETLIGPDPTASSVDRKRIYEKAQAAHRLRRDEPNRSILIVGLEDWPFPIPIVRQGENWLFDTEEGIEEIINRRIGENELNAILVARAYVEAQVQYSGKDRDGDEVLEYAQQLGSSPGKQDGLYWDETDHPDGELSPFGPLVAEAQEYLEGREPGAPFKGYYFRILPRQGDNPPGGAYDYVINGNMIAGFALLAYPAEHGNSGIMSFVVSHQGKVYQTDLGPDTASLAATVEIYDPDEAWTVVED